LYDAKKLNFADIFWRFPAVSVICIIQLSRPIFLLADLTKECKTESFTLGYSSLLF